MTPDGTAATVSPGVTVCQPRTPVPDAPGFTDDQYPHLIPLVQDDLLGRLAGRCGFDLWVYTPMAWPVAADALKPRVTILRLHG